jgi:muramoyltetrapeptide carboxypeptidase
MVTKGLRLPRRVAGPATVGIFAPSGFVDPEALARATAHLAALGHRVVVAPQTSARWRYFAGTDAERVDGLHGLLADSSIDILMAARGGYGWSRLLDRIDFDAVAASDQVIVGFSDTTVFSLAALTKARRLTFAGPMAAVDFGNGNVSPFMERHFWSVLARSEYSLDPVACTHGYTPQVIEGPLWGGNLSLLAHLVGTPYFPDIAGGILFVEEIAEEPYAVERLFFQLHHAGILARQKALVLADLDDCLPAASAGRYPYSMAEVVETLRCLLPYPVLTGLPFGHIHQKATLPLGGSAAVHITRTGYRLDFRGYNV